MMKSFKQLHLHQLDELLKPFAVVGRDVGPPAGWTRAVRDALGMTASQLAQRLSLKQSTIRTLERSEARRTITLKSLDKLAKGLGCRVVYAIVPERGKSLADLAREQARALARKRLARVSHTMKLEAQGLTKRGERQQLERLVDELLSGSRRKLWE